MCLLRCELIMMRRERDEGRVSRVTDKFAMALMRPIISSLISHQTNVSLPQSTFHSATRKPLREKEHIAIYIKGQHPFNFDCLKGRH